VKSNNKLLRQVWPYKHKLRLGVPSFHRIRRHLNDLEQKNLYRKTESSSQVKIIESVCVCANYYCIEQLIILY